MKILFALILFVSGNVYAEAPPFGTALREADHSAKLMTQYQAMGFDDSGNILPEGPACPEGRHLPTVREFAQYTQSLGAKGILDLSQVDPKHVPLGYKLIRVMNPDKKTDEFYYSAAGYKGHADELVFWSSSVDPVNSDLGYVYSLNDGSIGGYIRRYFLIAVRCL